MIEQIYKIMGSIEEISIELEITEHSDTTNAERKMAKTLEDVFIEIFYNSAKYSNMKVTAMRTDRTITVAKDGD